MFLRHGNCVLLTSRIGIADSIYLFANVFVFSPTKTNQFQYCCLCVILKYLVHRIPFFLNEGILFRKLGFELLLLFFFPIECLNCSFDDY